MNIRRADPRFVLPRLPRRAFVADGLDEWAEGLEWDGADTVSDPADADVIVQRGSFQRGSSSAVVSRAAGGPKIHVIEHGFAGRPTAPEGCSQTWIVLGRRSQPVAIVPSRRADCMDHALSNWRPSARASKAVHSALTRARSIEVALPKFTVVADDAGQPFFTSASEQLGGPEGLSGYLLTVGGTPLRRVAAVLWTPEAVAAREAAPTHVLKIARHRSMRPDTQTEEFALALLRGIGHIDSTAPASGPPGGVALPRILGAGEFDEHQVSLETAVAGSPLRDALMADPLGAARARDRVVRWLTGVASATRAPLDLAPVESALPLWGASAATIAEAIRLARVSGVSGALAHGDLLDGGNILVEGSSVAVIDWAAAKAGAPPLTDVLPFLLRSLCLEEAGTEEMASTVEAAIRIATGQSPRSRILFGAVAELCSALGIPDNARGPLATCVWAYAGSLQFVADRERALQGVEVRHEVLWPEAVARAWFDAPGLGLAWGAFPR